MKKLSAIALSALALSLAAVPMASAADWNGWITDASCGAHGAKAAHKDCAEKCAKKGDKLVFFNEGDKKIYSLDKQDLAKANIGYEVKVSGTANGDAIAVDSIAKAAPAAAQ
jgi:hypothetical protein